MKEKAASVTARTFASWLLLLVKNAKHAAMASPMRTVAKNLGCSSDSTGVSGSCGAAASTPDIQMQT